MGEMIEIVGEKARLMESKGICVTSPFIHRSYSGES